MSSFKRDRKRLEKEFDSVLEEVYPDELCSYVGRELSAASLTPALLCILTARATGREPNIEEAAGIQFIHAGLDATRHVIENGQRWEKAGLEPLEEDMVLLAADVLVTVGFDYLLDHYEDATHVINTFGEYEARARETEDTDESLEHSKEGYIETYTAAVRIGVGDENGDPPEEILSVAENLALLDNLKPAEKRLTERHESVSRLDEKLDEFTHEGHVKAIRDASEVSKEHTGTGTGTGVGVGVEAQD